MRRPHARPLWQALALGLAGLAAAPPSLAQVTFYEHEGFRGRSYTTTIPVADLQRRGFNDRASSAVVTTDRWMICEDSRFEGRCTVLRPGQYPSLVAMGLNDRVSSVRDVDRRARLNDQHYAPTPAVVGDFRRRGDERLFEAPVRTARAVFGAPPQRCWMERELVPQNRSEARAPDAIHAAVIGGILGHQVGAGRELQRCASTPASAAPAYWNVTYTFRGQEHQVQLMGPPGPTITVNQLGAPRA